MAVRTFKVASPHMRGTDIAEWQQWLVDAFAAWDIAYPLDVDGDYGPATRAATTSLCRAWGIRSGAEALKHGVTAELRVKLRHGRRTPGEQTLYDSPERITYRTALKARFLTRDVCTPIPKILDDSWGYHPPVHDGVDLICDRDAPLLAICTAEVIRADAGGWWGKGAPADPILRAKGDGIIVLRCLIRSGPFVPGLNFGYGHAEHARVTPGQVVKAGAHIGSAGFANTSHAHFMVNGRTDDRGVGDRDPRPYIDWARAHTA